VRCAREAPLLAPAPYKSWGLSLLSMVGYLLYRYSFAGNKQQTTNNK